LVVQAKFRDALFIDPFSFRRNRLPAAEVNIGQPQVAQPIAVSLLIVVIDE
jgi:hypothetical protein